MQIREGTIGGDVARVARISFTGELQYELSVPARYASSLMIFLLTPTRALVTLEPQATLGAPFSTGSAVSGFSADTVVLRERADIGCVLLTTAVDSVEIATAVGQSAGLDLPLAPGMIFTAPGRKAIWLSPRSWLIHCGVAEEKELVAHLNAVFPDKLVHAAAYTDYLCWLELSGAGALDLLTEGTFLSLERDGLSVRHAKRTLIAQVMALIVHERESVWLVAVERSRARYFADWLIAAVEARE
jgi:heterotetrameric sarcosine oxidase gamma subunit